MGFTQDDYDVLSKPFEAHEHKFKFGLTYIDKEAIFDRLTQIDPDFEYGLIGDFTEMHQTVMIKGYLIVKGVRREGVGTGSYLTKSKDGQAYSEFNLSKEIIGAYKGAATDLLARCGQMYGIGRYLRNTPKTVKDHRSLEQWLKSLNGVAQSAPAPQRRTQTDKPKEQRRVPATNGKQTKADAPDWTTFGFNFNNVFMNAEVVTTYPELPHRRNTMDKLARDGFIVPEQTDDEVVRVLLDRPDKA